MNWSRIRALVAIATVAAVSCGCAMYSPTRDKQGQAAQQAWSQVDLESQVAVPRKNLAALLTEQLSLEDDIWSQRRDDVARQMVSTLKVSEFRGAVDKRLVEVQGTTTNGNLIGKAAAAAEVANETLAEDRHMLAMATVSPPTCATATDEVKAAAFRQSLASPDNNLRLQMWDGMQKNYAEACKQAANAEQGLTNLGGAIALANVQLKKAKDAVDAQKGVIAALQKEQKDAQVEYQAAVKANTDKPGTAQQAVNDALKKVQTTEAKIAANSYAKSLISQQRLDALNKFLATYDDAKDGKAVSGGSQAAIALALFPDLSDKSKATLADAEKPNLVPLVIQKSIEQQKLEEAQRDADRQDQLVTLYQAQVTNLIEQAAAYAQVKAGLDVVWTAKTDDVFMRDVLQPYAANAPTDQRFRKEKTWEASARYLDAEGRLHAEFAKNRYRITALSYEETLTIAESGINQWKVLIDPSVELMADYGASGTKTSDINGLVNSIFLLAIAIGVY